MKQIGISIGLEAGGIGIRRGIGKFGLHHGPWRFIVVPSIARFHEMGLRLDGVIAQVWTDLLKPVAALKIPTVDVSNATLESPFGKVLLDNAGAGRLAAEHLLSLGLRHFVAIEGYAHEGFQLRAQSFREHLQRTPHTRCVSVRAYRHPQVTPDEKEVLHYRDFFVQQPRPFGVYAVNDLQASYVLEAARMGGLRVPDDVAVVGTDNAVEVCDLTDPPLTSIELNTERVGYEAAKLLAGMMDSAPASPSRIIVPAESVVTRVSTDVLAIDDPDLVAAARYIRTHATEGIDVGSVLQMIPISRRRLERRFREVAGHGLHDEIQRVRIGHAKRLLVETELSMLEVAIASGFTSQSYFGRAFNRAEGMTPTEYRKRRGR